MKYFSKDISDKICKKVISSGIGKFTSSYWALANLKIPLLPFVELGALDSDTFISCYLVTSSFWWNFKEH